MQSECDALPTRDIGKLCEETQTSTTFNRLNPLTGEMASSVPAMKATDIAEVTARGAIAF
jgi:hypothetical protein